MRFINSKRGVGFPERMCGGQWCGLYYNSICVMPDGTKIRAEEFNNYDNWQEIFVNAILNWVKRPTLKIVDVIEFMDIWLNNSVNFRFKVLSVLTIFDIARG